MGPKHLFGLIVLAALLIRIAAALYHPAVQGDEIAYLGLAESLNKGQGMTDISGMTSTVFFPLLPILIAGLWTIVHNYVLAGQIIVIVFGTLILVPVYLLATEFTDENIALKAAALAAVLPLLVNFSALVYTESVYTFFVLMAMFFTWQMLKNFKILSALLIGAALGLAYLANPSAIYYMLVVIVLALVLAVLRKRWLPVLRSLALILFVFAVFAFPYVVFLHNHLNHWTFSGKTASSNILASTQSIKLSTPEWEQDAWGLTDDGHSIRDYQRVKDSVDPVTYFFRHPLQGAKLFVTNSYFFYSSDFSKTLPLWLLALFGLGVVAMGKYRNWPVKFGFLLVMLAPVMLLFMIDYRSRFFVPFIAMSLVWFALGWNELEDWFTQTLASNFKGLDWKRPAKILVAALVLVPVLLFSAATVVKQGNPKEYQQAGELLQQIAGPDKRIMSRSFTASFYAEGTAIILPYADYRRTTQYARYNRVDYVIIGKDDILNWRPGMQPLLESEDQHPDWKLVGDVYSGTDQEVLIFQLNEANVT